MENIKLYNGDCMYYFPDITGVALCVTSPPYNCGKDYEKVMDYEDYYLFTGSWMRGAYKSLISGGRLAVNIPWWIFKKPRLDAVDLYKRAALHAGFMFLDKIIWIKGDENNVHVSGGYGGGGCGWGTYMSPSGPSIRCASEPILIFCKESRGRKVLSGKGRGDCVKGDMTKEEFMKFTTDTWFIRGGGNIGHPATFPVDIPYRLIKLYTFPGEVVVDPFMGSGTSGQAAISVGRKFIGIELHKKYYDMAVVNIASEHRTCELEKASNCI